MKIRLNNKSMNFRITAAAAALGILSAALPSYTVFADTQDDLNAAQQKADSYSASNAQLSDELNSLLGDLNSSMENLADINSQISEKKEQLTELNAQIEEDEASADEMYDSMALRVRYMYENSRSNSAVETLLSSKDFAEFLKRTSYVVSISTYDRDKLQELSDLIAEEQETKEQQESELAALNDLQSSLTAAQANFEDMIAQKQEQLQQNESLMAEADALVASYQAQLASEQEQLDADRLAAESERAASSEAAASESASSTSGASEGSSLLTVASTSTTASTETTSETETAETSAAEETQEEETQQETEQAETETETETAAEEETASAETATSETTSSASYSQTELDVMAALMEGEAGPNNYDAEVAVGSCVMNRLYNGAYGGSVLEVIYAPNQFIANSQYSYMFEAILARGASESCYAAARAVLSGTITHPYLHFVSEKTAAARGISGVNIGGNVYY
ncbi:MAG: cell wall hydrolase [Lachnospiraceae bacterium]|jgi:peptidoglycan hydrolase CwlO-like protein